ncbi:fumarylacetoacetate hydrolase family protein [Rhodoferax sp.]|uniref:fumarylacetoacetate hydrolase family protein n=1 Tax=Rhodoferax sp. TaxID=50421 RepID=UPI0026390D50|nr:fumarylacetoacetate hydrolase family protein [Rhodoferax sp.]MDD2926254.1 fumarylacetoacetate hydrolase family protein [Rhodoferax sp.]
MQLCRFNDNRLGLVQGDEVIDVTAALQVLPTCSYPLPTHDLFIANLAAVSAEVKKLVDAKNGESRHALSGLKLLSPIANPGKVVAAPVNYLKHLQEARDDKGIHHQNQIGEIQRVGLFLKATSSVAGASAGVVIARPDRRNDHEIELVAVIGKAGRNIPAANALEHVAGYCVGLDMTVRGPEERSMRKSPDGYTVLGPYLTTADDMADVNNLDLVIAINGEVRQRANTRDLIMNVADLIEFASSFYTLHPGDILMTGTPEGVSQVFPGDRMTAEITGLGRIVVDIRAG